MGRESGKRIRIAHVMGEFLRGGTERIVLDLLSRLDARKFDIHVFCTTSEGLDEVRGDFEGSGISTSLATTGLGNLSGRGWGLKTGPRKVLSLLKLAGEIRRGKFTIVHTHGLTNNLYGRLAAVAAGTPVIVTHEHNANDYTRIDKFLWRILNLKTALNLSVSDTIGDLRVRSVPSSRRKSVTLLNGIDLGAFRPAGAAERVEAKRKLGVDARKRVVGTMCRLASWKRVDLFLRSAALAVEDCPDAHFLVVGDGEARSELESLSAGLGIRDSVTFTGWIMRPQEALWAMDIFACLSDGREGFGLVTAEAMACGLPTVAVDSPLNREVLSGDCAMLVMPEPSAVAEAVTALLADESRAATMGRAASMRASERYDIARAARELEAVYENLAEGLEDKVKREACRSKWANLGTTAT